MTAWVPAWGIVRGARFRLCSEWRLRSTTRRLLSTCTQHSRSPLLPRRDQRVPGPCRLQLQVLSSAPTATCAGSANQPAQVSPAKTSQLANWPVQLHLLSPLAPFLRDADLLLVADCVPFACADFHSRILDGRPVAIGCPKLDDGPAYVQKLSQIIHTAQIRSITVIHMEVPCCTGLLRIAEAAVQQAASDIPVRSVIVTVRGQIVVPSRNDIA